MSQSIRRVSFSAHFRAPAPGFRSPRLKGRDQPFDPADLADVSDDPIAHASPSRRPDDPEAGRRQSTSSRDIRVGQTACSGRAAPLRSAHDDDVRGLTSNIDAGAEGHDNLLLGLSAELPAPTSEAHQLIVCVD